MPEPNWAAGAGVASLVGAVGYWIKRQVGRIDDHAGRLAVLERTALTTADLERTETRLADVIERGHRDIVERIAAAQSSATAAHDRMDRYLGNARNGGNSG